MIILQGNKIERSFSGDVLFDNINIQVDERDRIALVGRNGAGKSTLLKILVGELLSQLSGSSNHCQSRPLFLG